MNGLYFMSSRRSGVFLRFCTAVARGRVGVRPTPRAGTMPRLPGRRPCGQMPFWARPKAWPCLNCRAQP